MARDFPSSKISETPSPPEIIAAGILPRVIHRDYFQVSGEANVETEPEKFGLVRPLGNSVFSFLAFADEHTIRNVHLDELERLQLTVEDANHLALDNLRRIAFDGQTIQQQITNTQQGNDWAVWIGNDFTSSCILLPELFSWSQTHLGGESFLVRVPSTQTMFILQAKNRSLLGEFDKVIAKALKGCRNIVSTDWFALSPLGISPMMADVSR